MQRNFIIKSEVFSWFYLFVMIVGLLPSLPLYSAQPAETPQTTAVDQTTGMAPVQAPATAPDVVMPATAPASAPMPVAVQPTDPSIAQQAPPPITQQAIQVQQQIDQIKANPDVTQQVTAITNLIQQKAVSGAPIDQATQAVLAQGAQHVATVVHTCPLEAARRALAALGSLPAYVVPVTVKQNLQQASVVVEQRAAGVAVQQQAALKPMGAKPKKHKKKKKAQRAHQVGVSQGSTAVK